LKLHGQSKAMDPGFRRDDGFMGGTLSYVVPAQAGTHASKRQIQL
jgi:hypothetical protein